MNTRRNKTHKILVALAFALMMSLSATAQVFVLDNEDNNRLGTGANGELSNVIVHGEDHDQTNFVPMGGGALLLMGLGGAYMLCKKVKDED